MVLLGFCGKTFRFVISCDKQRYAAPHLALLALTFVLKALQYANKDGWPLIYANKQGVNRHLATGPVSLLSILGSNRILDPNILLGSNTYPVLSNTGKQRCSVSM